MCSILKQWFNYVFARPEAVTLTLWIVASAVIFSLWGDILAPVFAALVIAYVLEGPIGALQACHVPRILAISLVIVTFAGLLLLVIFGVFPLLGQQAMSLLEEVPTVLSKGQNLLSTWVAQHSEYVSAEVLTTLVKSLRDQITSIGQWLISASLYSIANLLVVVVYFVMVPLLVFFLLIDKFNLMQWLQQFAPKDSNALSIIWNEINQQLGNYMRGKALEIAIVAGVSYICFAVLGLDYALLLAVLVGLSVIIPFVGATLVTIPVLVIALVQWGWSSHFATLVIVYTIIQVLDANVLVPLLFYEAVKIHPIAIIIAIIFFSGIWGLWGIFFAIPLAVVARAIIRHWPTTASLIQ